MDTISDKTVGSNMNSTNYTNYVSLDLNLSLPNSPELVGISNEDFSGQLPWNEQILAFCEMRFKGFTEIAIPAFIVSYIFFFGIGGFLHVSKHDI